MKPVLQVFAGQFSSREEACLYTEEQWEPEPNNSVSDDEYAAWENRNPSWKFREDLCNIYLDSDFIETIDGNRRYQYLESYLVDKADLTKIQETAADSNILLLLFPDAFGGFEAKLISTPRLIYCGSYYFRWP